MHERVEIHIAYYVNNVLSLISKIMTMMYAWCTKKFIGGTDLFRNWTHT